MNKSSTLAQTIAEELLANYSIGNSSSFCDEVDWDPASKEELITLIAAKINDWWGECL